MALLSRLIDWFTGSPPEGWPVGGRPQEIMSSPAGPRGWATAYEGVNLLEIGEDPQDTVLRAIRRKTGWSPEPTPLPSNVARPDYSDTMEM